ncbi:MAG: anthranilate synthase component I [Peptococcaceae bacterium]|nr:anthranilate synthase component I [Peptococcaceae bacterium]
MILPARENYLNLSRSYTLIPVSCEQVVDTETPISVYMKLNPAAPAYLLESVEGGERLGRYSFLGFDPLWTLRFKDGEGLIDCGDRVIPVQGNPFRVLRDLMRKYHCPPRSGEPRFWGGAVGFWGYDAVRYLEYLPTGARDDLQLPDAMLAFSKVVLVFDHVQHTVKVIYLSQPGNDPEDAYEKACQKIEEVLATINETRSYNQGLFDLDNGSLKPLSNQSTEDFCTNVGHAKNYIAAGDAIQVVLSRRFQVPFKGSPINLYRRLRSINPSPHLFYLDFGDPVVAGASPEMLVRVDDGVVTTRPIAGTRPRGRNAAEDGQLAAELLADPKERAEHVMLVDLGRNDLSRVCLPGTVKVSKMMEVEYYSHVMHLTSEVCGKLAPRCDALDALMAVFPAGTVSGAPKVRAMEIIEELEPSRRGIYAGAVGYFGLSGNLDTCIAIRTVIISQKTAYIQAGAGIVADSVPLKEYHETAHKAEALLQALGGYDQ